VLSAVALDVRVALLLTVAVMVLGVALGVLAGYGRGGVDTLIMRVADVLIAFPFLILVIVLAAVFGPGLTGIYVAVIGTQWTIFARLTRAEMLVLRELDFMRAAETLGYSRARILVRHALPNVVGPALALAPAQVVGNVLYLATLSYLGLGVQPPQAELGASIAEGQQYLQDAWWMATLPGLVLVALGVAFSLVGDGLAARLGQDEVPLA
jgi:peptide/nickel transport system permease protein